MVNCRKPVSFSRSPHELRPAAMPGKVWTMSYNAIALALFLVRIRFSALSIDYSGQEKSMVLEVLGGEGVNLSTSFNSFS